MTDVDVNSSRDEYIGGMRMKTLSDSISEWLEVNKKPSVKDTTYNRLITSFTLMRKYGIANINIANLRAKDVQIYLNQLVADNYALTTIKKQYSLIYNFFEYACGEGIADKPLHKAVNLPSQDVVKKKKREIVAYTKEEQTKLMSAFDEYNSIDCNLFRLILETGLRVGEALALSWDDVNWGRRSIRINKTLVQITNARQQYIRDGAKSYNSNRTIPLSTTAYELLKYLRDIDKTDCNLIFHDECNKFLTYESVRYWLKKACIRAGIVYTGVHTLRHTFATNCYYRGCNVKVLSKLLGHADVTITYNIYINLYGDALEEMRGVLE